ncbi:MAG: hypothetical protein AAFP76_15570 [Bacteroidota bacterium]
MKTNHQTLHGEMRTLIENSCAVNPKTHLPYQSFQKALLKFYFGAADVKIHYDQNCITLFSYTAKEDPQKDPYQAHDTVGIQVEYTDLETALKQCLEVGEKQNRFYRSLLFHYNRVQAPLGWSA